MCAEIIKYMSRLVLPLLVFLGAIIPIAGIIYEIVKERKRLCGIRKETEELKKFNAIRYRSSSPADPPQCSVSGLSQK